MGFEEQLHILKQMLPDADPTYLQDNCKQLMNNPAELQAFITEALETKDYPTMKDYLR